LRGAATILKLDSLERNFGALVVADKISLELNAGEALGIIGPNGAGKTTLFALISGALQPSSGKVFLDGRDVTSLSTQARCRAGIGRSHQVPLPFEKLTVFENVLTAACFGQGKRERDVVDFCGDVLERTHLLAKANRLAGALTLLDRKRLELARALGANPRLLLLDEIAGGLTEGECRDLVAMIRAIHASGVAILWIEHIVHALVAVVSRLVVLNFGRLIAQGEPAQVMNLAEVRQIYLGSPV
jgi:branched-chain amino acid transport system ATP-binding protein